MTVLMSTAAKSPPPRLRRPRQVQQPVDDLGRAKCLPLDLLKQPRPRIVRVGALEKHLRKARDAGQRRVDFVRHSRGKHADRRHLLGDLQLLLELHAPRDVLDDDDRADRRGTFVVGGAQRHDGRVDDDRTAGRPLPAVQRDARQGGAVGRVAARGADRLHEGRIEQLLQLAADGLGARNAVELLQRGVPPDDAIAQIDDEEAVVERLQDVFVEGAHAIELVRLDVQLAVQPGVLERGRDLAGHRRQKPRVLAVQRLAGVLAPQRQHGDGAFFRNAGHEVVQPRIAPELDFLDGKTARRNRVVERDDVALVEPRRRSRSASTSEAGRRRRSPTLEPTRNGERIPRTA